MEPSEEIEKLREALEYAISIIENYEMDIRNPGPVMGTYVNLVESGFCQGRIYKSAIRRIRAIAAGGK